MNVHAHKLLRTLSATLGAGLIAVTPSAGLAAQTAAALPASASSPYFHVASASAPSAALGARSAHRHPARATARTASRPHAEHAYQSPTGAQVRVINAYAPGANNWNPGHRGVDLASNYGDSVYAAASGTVIYAGTLNDREIVSIADSRGIRTTYEPVAPIVSKGEHVTRGQKIGTINGYHCGVGVACLHWGAKRGAKGYFNPLWLLNPPRVRLLE